MTPINTTMPSAKQSKKQRIISHIAQIAFPEPQTAPPNNYQGPAPGGPSHLSPYPPAGNPYGGYPQSNAPTPYSAPGNAHNGHTQQHSPSPHPSPYGGYPQQSTQNHNPYPPPGNSYGGYHPQQSAPNPYLSAGNSSGGYPQQGTPNPYVSGGNSHGGYAHQAASYVSSMFHGQPQSNNNPVSFLFHLPKLMNKSGKITDESGNTLYMLTSEAENHTFMQGLVDLPLYITRNDGTKVGNIHWKSEYADTKVEPFTVWGDHNGRLTCGKKKGEHTKAKFMGDIADKKGVFPIPTSSGPLDFSWESKDKGDTYLLLDRQRVTSGGLDVKDGYNAVARYTCHKKSRNPNARLEIMPETLNRIPGILDACIMTCFICEAMKLARIAEIAGAVGSVGEAVGAVAGAV